MHKADKHNTVDYYFDDINKCKTISNEQVVENIKQIRELSKTLPDDNDQICALRNAIIEGHLKLVIRFAKEYQKVGVPLADLIQEGNFGLIKAIDKFDPEQIQVKFMTYAVWWIKEGFLKVIKSNGKLIRLPTHVQEALSRVEKSREAHERKIQETAAYWHTFLTTEEVHALFEELPQPTMEVLAKEEGLTEEELEKIYNVGLDPISLDSVVQGEVQKSLKDLIIDPSIDVEKDAEESQMRDSIKKALTEVLTPAESEVIILRFGLFDETPHTLQECAARMNRSREHVRQLETTGKDKLEKLQYLRGFLV